MGTESLLKSIVRLIVYSKHEEHINSPDMNSPDINSQTIMYIFLIIIYLLDKNNLVEDDEFKALVYEIKDSAKKNHLFYNARCVDVIRSALNDPDTIFFDRAVIAFKWSGKKPDSIFTEINEYVSGKADAIKNKIVTLFGFIEFDLGVEAMSLWGGDGNI
jgi:hypothetical protein